MNTALLKFMRWPMHRTVAFIFSWIALTGWLPNAIAAGTDDAAATAKIDASLLQSFTAAEDARYQVLVRMNDHADLSAASQIKDWNARGQAVYSALRGTANDTQSKLMAQVMQARSAGKASSVKSFWIVNAVMLTADRDTIVALASRSDVRAVLSATKLQVPDVIVESAKLQPQAVEWGISKIRATEVWSTYGTSGAGVVVANVDTGVQYNHPALVGHYRGNLGGGNFNHDYNWFDPTNAYPVPTDDNSHGTHTMGTMVGDDGAGNQIGVAPGAQWIAAFGCCPSNEALLEAQQFMLAPTDRAGNNPNPDLRPQVVNQSWGGPGGSEIFEDVVAALRASGIFPAFSAGNNGAASATGCGRLGSPGDTPSAFSVGNTTSGDGIAGTSSRGPNPITGKVGPEVSAPGSNIRSSVPGSGYANFSGTSMASPHVAGAVALLIAVEPKLKGQIEQLEELLRKTSVPLTSAQTCGGVAGSEIPNNAFGWGRIDVKAAADMIFHAGTIAGTVTVAGTPTANVTVSFARLGKTLTTRSDASGHYSVFAGEGNWAMTASLRGQSVSAPVVAVTQNATTIQDLAIGAIGTFAVTGSVTQVGTGAPIRAMLMIAGDTTLAPVWSSAIDGSYSINVPVGSWTLTAMHPGHQTVSQIVSAGATQNLQMTPQQNYACHDNTEIGGPIFNWIDVSNGTAFPLDDDASSSAQTLPASFNYFGSPFTTVRINSNGFLYFGATTYTTANMYLPFEGQPNNDLMALGEDLNPALGSQGTVYAKTIGSSFIVQYQAVQHWASGFPETFQIILDTATGAITYQYQTIGNANYTSTGVEDSTGSVGQLYSFRNSANIVAGRAVTFTPGSGNAINWGCDHALTVSIADDADPVDAGQPITYRIHWNLTGFGGSPALVITSGVPANTTFISASGGITPGAGNSLTWNLGDQRPKASGDAWFTVVPNAASVVNVNAAINDASGEARSAMQSTTVLGVAPADAVFENGFE